MRILLFCENKYSINILHPLQVEADRQGVHEVLWYVHGEKIPEFPYDGQVRWTGSMQEAYDFSPEAIFVPGNIVPYYLPGVKIQIFHGYAAEKKDHWVIRRYFDLYFTQGPFFTRGFEALARKYGDFGVVETGWPKQDWIYSRLHEFDAEKEALLSRHGKKQLVLYAPTFSPSLTSLPYVRDALVRLAEERDVLLLLKFHPLTRQEWIDEYRQLAASHEHILWIDDFDITKYELMCDVMISDTSSTIYECLLLDKPVVTYGAVAKDIYWLNITDPEELPEAFDKAQTDPACIAGRRWVIENYDPYLDGKVCERMLSAAAGWLAENGVPRSRRVNLWRKYTGIKRFGRVRRHR